MTLGAHKGYQRLDAIIGRLRHEGCGGALAVAEPATGIPGSSSGTVRRVVLVGDG